MAGETILKTDGGIIEFNRATLPHHHVCTFCIALTNRVLAFRQRTALELPWNYVPWCDGCFAGIHRVSDKDEGAGEFLVNTGRTTLSLNRRVCDGERPCNFCQGSTSHVLAYRLRATSGWDMVPWCVGCFSGIRNVPIRDENGGMPKGSGRIIIPT